MKKKKKDWENISGYIRIAQGLSARYVFSVALEIIHWCVGRRRYNFDRAQR